MDKSEQFGLAPLMRLSPRIVRREYNRLDGFVLALALAYNDFKTCNWILATLPESSSEISPDNGQIGGFRIHASRMMLGILHEVLVAISVADKAGLLKQKEFVKCLRKCSAAAQRDWEALRLSAVRNVQKDPFLKWLARARNSVVSHYYNPKDLHRGYVSHFHEGETTVFNEHAYASRGATLRGTRFYFADAAAAAAYDNVGAFMQDAERHFERVNRALSWIVESYIEFRHITETRQFPSRDKPR